MSDPGEVSPDELGESLASGEELNVLDVRDRDEYEQWRIEGPGVASRQVPHVRFLQAQVDGDPTELVDDVAEPILVVCGRGEASAQVAEQLRSHGLDARNLAEGMVGWARVHRVRELSSPSAEDTDPTIARDAGSDIVVLQCDRPASGCLAHVVIAGDEAVVIDPLRAFATDYAELVADRDATVTAVVDTHVHADHVSGLRAVAEATDASPYLPSGAVDRGLAFDATLLSDGETIPIGEHSLEAVHAPGHTSQMTALQLSTPDRKLLFGGDLLFQRAVARPDLEAGADAARALARDLHATLRNRVFDLPDGTVVLPGHHRVGERPALDHVYGAPVGELRDRITVDADPEEFADRILADLPERPNNYEEIVETNLGRRELDDSAAFEVELGPNNCAATGD